MMTLVVRKEERRGAGGEGSVPGRRKTNKSTGVGPGGNVGSQSHQVFYKHKVLTSYSVNPFMGLILLFSDLHHDHFKLAFI